MRGDWFCWLSHDDRYLPLKTARQLAFLDMHPEARIAACDFEIIDGAGNVIDTYRAARNLVRNGFELLETWVFGCALMIHRSCLDVPFNETNRTTQDLEMWLHLVSRNAIHWIPEVLCQLREHAAQGSRTESRYGRDKDELFADQNVPPAIEHGLFRVKALTLGYSRDVLTTQSLSGALGANVTAYSTPGAIKPYYGSGPHSFYLFLRLRGGSSSAHGMHM